MEKRNKVHRTNLNKKWVNQLLSLGSLIGFLLIRISYNNTKSITVLEALLETIRESSFKSLFSINQGYVNLLWLTIIIVVSGIGLIFFSLMNKIKMILFFELFFLLIWVFVFNTYYSMIEVDLFFQSSFFFLVFSIINIIVGGKFLLLTRRKKHKK